MCGGGWSGDQADGWDGGVIADGGKGGACMRGGDCPRLNVGIYARSPAALTGGAMKAPLFYF